MVNALYKSGLTPVTFIAAAFAYSTSYIGDIANGALRVSTRCGRTRFALSRFWANAICGALGVAFGEMAFFLILHSAIQDTSCDLLNTLHNAMTMLSYRAAGFLFILSLYTFKYPAACSWRRWLWPIRICSQYM